MDGLKQSLTASNQISKSLTIVSTFLNKVNMNMLDVELVSYKKCMKYN